MLRRFATTLAAAATALTLLAAPAFADDVWSSYKDFTHTRCEAPKTIADMKEAAKAIPGFNALFRLKVLSSTTVRATPRVLACRVRFTAIYKDGPHLFSGRYTIDLLANGKSHINFDYSY
jgi:hypothetical protein